MMVSEEEQVAAAREPKPKGRYNIDHRALLFGSRFGRSDAVNAKGQAAAVAYAAAEQEELQLHNEELAERLSSKVDELRDISLSIAEETKDSVRQADDMNRQFDRAGGWLTQANAKLQVIAKNPGSRHMCTMVLFSLALVLLLYILGAAGTKGSVFLAPKSP
ncbi:BET1 [Symbiodinium natans]|uniref:BET1 protein n=1 Tax=Symbiodinium natans TaxID=878477 RepID=A0A812LHX7_9DINO|nr:BET1 [Symbiodinium natans]